MDEAVHAANALSGVVSHLSAALYWGWEVKEAPAAQVTVPRKRRVRPERRIGVGVHWADLTPDQVVAPGVTSRQRTLSDCLTTLAFDEGLAVADSALRHGACTQQGLTALAHGLRGRGSGTARRVAGLADGRAANPFESVLRALAVDAGLDVEPQQQIGEFRPDLVDEGRRLVLEADSHTWHSSRAALRRDCRRYNALVLGDWRVLRFTWEDVMHRPARVVLDLKRAAEQAQPPRGRRKRPS
jgi:very-short-patch-repair endonuclease